MSRRALPKFDPTLDLTWHLLTAEGLPRPWDAQPLFGRRSPLELEVGCGKGLFLRNAAKADARRDFLGIEISRKYARFAAGQLAKRQLRNARVVRADAQQVFATCLPAGVLAAVHIYFPDPWWKKRHHKRRLMNARFLQRVQQALQPGGQLHFWTDVEPYFAQSLELLQQETDLVGPFPVGEAGDEYPMEYRTHFERRMRLHDKAVYRSRFSKREA